ncbi:TonB-dependent receptor [Spirosoma endbachense]|uniref:Outer membrane beta-barrel protein n=1 Tax=Spirosoma endbachense TaxID=2666025 RepID=A0A6P1W167_9BACT|nr:TonB-dependent receptor [Spirosoma endbachense]QHV97729.1 outer membrane beta-barrel protein [Spirosoma endbachense]
MKLLLLNILFVFGCLPVSAGVIKGRATDAVTGQPVIGATLLLENTKLYGISGLDGSYSIKNVPAGTYKIRVSYVSYRTKTLDISITGADQIITLDLPLETENDRQIAEVTVKGKRDGSSDRTARDLERNALQVTNIVSGRTIELSPDLTVANVIQRVSGISIERNSNGDGQYAILRGMDKRYNYTLVNGVKIPSPDNRYRYVPLDIFPSELLDRLEVYKALTPNMEGDAVGGAINMVMKDAPDRPTLLANLSTGYSELFFDRPFTSFDTKNINVKSPYEQFGNQYSAKFSDFNKASTTYTSHNPPPNLLGSFAIGNRFFNQRFGVMLAGSLQNTFRGSNSLFFNGDVVDTLRGITLTKLSDRQYSERQTRYGLHAKMDYRINENNKIQWFNALISLTNQQIRETKSTELGIGGFDPVLGNATLGYETRSRLTKQKIYNSTLQGTHQLTSNLAVNWSAVYSLANNTVPDQTYVPLLGIRKNFVEQRTTVQDGQRRWEHNSDTDLAGYLNLTLKTTLAGIAVDWMAGGLYRDKQRTNFYNNYTLRPANPFAQYGVDFTDYSQIVWTIQNPLGSVASALNYDATEKTSSGYLQFRTTDQPLEVIGGVRVEHTDQGYAMKFPIGEENPTGSQIYTDVLPSLHFRYHPTERTNWRLSYFRSLNRPGFFEIVPYRIVNEEYQERGNPNLKRALADNVDLRYEFFPRPLEQFMVGLFYKHIQDPIEYTLQKDAIRGQDLYYGPGNFGNATNFGLELDAIKYFQHWGVKANYTYTNSSITTPKSKRIRNAQGDLQTITVNQTRSLYGQSAHVANLSLLYKDSEHGWDGQLAASYTGGRINTVSQFVDNDLYQKGFIQMDASAEKRLGNGFLLFAKANNLLNTPTEIFIKNASSKNSDVPDQDISGKTLIRRDFFQRSYFLGIRYKL